MWYWSIFCCKSAGKWTKLYFKLKNQVSNKNIPNLTANDEVITYDKTVPIRDEDKLSNECTNATETPNELSTNIEQDNEKLFEHS